MTKKLKRIAPLQLGIVAGVFYALISLIIVPFFILIASEPPLHLTPRPKRV